MKKKLIALLMVAVSAFSAVFLTACSGDSYAPVRITGTQDKSYVVTSNGGSSVQFGNYIYFVNGKVSSEVLEDKSGKNNIWGKVVKGGLYRAELKGKKATTDAEKEIYGANAFIPSIDVNTGLEFVSTPTDVYYDGELIDVVNVQQIVPKIISPNGYADGGLFIIDDYIYYTSPNNQKNSVGQVQSSLTDFFRTRLNGRDTQKICTVSTGEFGIYKIGNFVYHVVKDGTSLVSRKLNDSKTLETKTIAENVTEVIFPKSSTYDGSITYKLDGAEDFIYFTRAVVKTDKIVKTGNVLEMVDPSGDIREEIIKDGKTVDLETFSGEYLYFRYTSGDITSLRYTNLASLIAALTNAANASGIATKEGAALASISNYTQVMPFTIKGSDRIYTVATTASAVFLFENGSNSKQIYSGAATIKNIFGNYVYFVESADAELQTLYRTNVFEAVSEKSEADKKQQVTEHQFYSTNTFGLDVCAGYLVYVSSFIDDWAADYTRFKKLTIKIDEAELFVGQRTEDDTKPATDTDGDGIVDVDDDDIDGDGILNENDNDVDGDGILNENDDDYTA